MSSKGSSAIYPIGFGVLGFALLIVAMRNSALWGGAAVLTCFVLAIAFQMLAARSMDEPSEAEAVEEEADEEEGEGGESVPICSECLTPLSPLDDHCQTCGEADGLTRNVFPI